MTGEQDHLAIGPDWIVSGQWHQARIGVGTGLGCPARAAALIATQALEDLTHGVAALAKASESSGLARAAE
jgi:hypothetical protein